MILRVSNIKTYLIFIPLFVLELCNPLSDGIARIIGLTLNIKRSLFYIILAVVVLILYDGNYDILNVIYVNLYLLNI